MVLGGSPSGWDAPPLLSVLPLGLAGVGTETMARIVSGVWPMASPGSAESSRSVAGGWGWFALERASTVNSGGLGVIAAVRGRWLPA